MKRRHLLLGTALGATASAVGAAPAAAAAAAGPAYGIGPTLPTRRPTLPTIVDRLRTLPATTRQVVLVNGDGYASTYAWVSTFVRSDRTWRRVEVSLPARIGANGFSDHHVEGVPTTPTGLYPLGATMYGIAANPGVRYPYHVLQQNDWWNENSGSPGYNTFQHGSDPGGASEALWRITPAYTHFAVINYNLPAVPGRGSGIFLHQSSASGGPTAGCVSLGASDLVRVLTWLDPAAAPRILLCPEQNVLRY